MPRGPGRSQQHGEVADKTGRLQFQRRGCEHGASDNYDDGRLRSDYDSGGRAEGRRGGSVGNG